MARDRARHRQDGEPIEGVPAYWQKYAEAFAEPLTANGLVGNFVANPNVTGAYAESWVRDFAGQMLPGFRISTGAIIRTTDVIHNRDLRRIPQIDIIVWDPTELPALFEKGEFALIHTQAARAIIEVKRTLRGRGKLSEQLEARRMRLLSEYRKNVLGIVVSSTMDLFDGAVSPDWVERSNRNGPPRMTRLLEGARGPVDVNGVFAFIYFLSHVSRVVRPRTA